ncbi:hypothetical protein SUDANB6_02881 [Streptomyces sp. enrichment culture]|uniref:hypothetical protein n=1 Tax=Streptomyces sp. enrichment culture TaxID=1795815 RepID=UPI003F56463D
MSDQSNRDMSHPLEQVTGERDVPPEQDRDRSANEEAGETRGRTKPPSEEHEERTGETP